MIQANQYAHDVISGKIVACKFVKQAAQRHLNDIEKSNSDDFDYVFDEEDAMRYSSFCELLHLWKGQWANQKVVLQPWQLFIIQVLLGWKHKDTGLRRFKKGYIEMARKNAKTTLVAMIALAMLMIDNEIGGQIYSAATKEEQARIVVNDMAGIINSTPLLGAYFQFRKAKEGYSRIMYTDSYSFVRPLGRDSKTQDGFDPSIGLIDEYHAHPTDELVDVIESGMGSRREPLLLIITTAGFNIISPCFQFRKSCESILTGESIDDSLFCIIYTLDEDDDFQDENVWIKSNPNLDISVKKEFLKGQLIDALNRPSKRVPFLTKNMNMWVDAPTVWIPDEQWMQQSIDVSIEDLIGYECYGGLDLASTKDTTALVFYFPDYKGKELIYPFFFIPKETAKENEKEVKVPYTQWAKDGWITLTDGGMGRATDYDYIRKKIEDLTELGWYINSIAFDKFNSSQLVGELRTRGYIMEDFSQSIGVISFPTKDFERRIVTQKLFHNGSPVMRWQIKNVFLYTDANENQKIDKAKSINKVDGPVAAVMALARNLQVNSGGEIVYIA